MGITVKGIGAGNSNVDILPRLRLMASPYSFLATGARSMVSPNGAELVTAANGEVTINGDLTANNISGDGSGLTGFGPSQIPALDAGKIISGTLSPSRIPNIDASKITTGSLSIGRLDSVVAREDGVNTFTEKNTFRGDVKIGPSNAEVHAAGGVERLRIVRGLINANGTRAHGSGFTSTGSSFVKLITFDPPFSDTPTVTATSTGPQVSVQVSGVSATFVQFVSYDGNNLASSAGLNFIAVGPR